MATCALCNQKFAGEIELDFHLALFHNLDAQASTSSHNLKRKSLSNDDVIETKKGWIFWVSLLDFELTISIFLKNG